MDFIINFFKEQPLIAILLVCALVAYFYFDNKTKKDIKGKTPKEIANMTPEERAAYKKEMKEKEIKRTQNTKSNTHVHTANVYDERRYESAPKDGTSLHHKGTGGVSFINKKTSNAMALLPEYEHYLNEIREKNLNHLARNLEMINNDCVDNIKYLQKRGYFKNVQIDEAKCRIFYTDQATNSEFITEEEKNAFEELENNPYEILKTDFEGEHVPGINIQHVCPHCGTPNIIDSDTKEYNCYYCLDKVVVKGKNKK